jgi:cell division cycle protein 20 (cofactor of APC complex)
MVHAYPSMERVVEIRDAHECRVLWSALSPNGDVVCTGAGDENLKFWKIWEVEKKKGKGKEGVAVETTGTNSTRGGILSLR